MTPRTMAWVLGTASVIACADPPAHIAAVAGTDSLSVERVSAWIARVPTGRPSPVDAGFVALTWIDYTLFAQALAEGRPLDDASTMAAALEPDRFLTTLRIWHDTLAGRRPPAPAAIIDSLVESVRVFQQILVRVPDPRDLRQAETARAQAESLLTRITAGEDFATLARTHSEDASRETGGMLPARPRGALPPEFERVAWQLEPGALAGVGSRFGFHVVRRPRTEEILETLRRHADSLLRRQADSIYLDSLMTTRRVAVGREAPGLLRALFDDPASVVGRGSAPLATWEGGSLDLATASRWINLLEPAPFSALRNASEIRLEAFVRELAGQYLLFSDAQAAGIRLGAADRLALEEGYRRALGELRAMLGVADTTHRIPPAEAEGRVTALMEGMTSGRVRYRPLPSALGAVLREERGYRLIPSGLREAARIAMRRLRGADAPTPE